MSQRLPSISSLLINTPAQKGDAQPPPILNLSPPSPSLSLHSGPFSPINSPYLHPTAIHNKAKLSPLLSPISFNSSNDLPPIHGDDPPQILRLPSPSCSFLTSPSTPTSPTINNNSSASILFCPLSPRTELFSHQHRHQITPNRDRKRWLSLSPPTIHSSSNSTAASSHTSCSTHMPLPVGTPQSTITTTNNDPSSAMKQHRTRSKSFDDSTINNSSKKQKRKRQPESSETADKGVVCDPPQYTFLTPTVLHNSDTRIRRNKHFDRQRYHSAGGASSNIAPQNTITLTTNVVETTMMTAFTNSNMDTVLNMPSKKRGRKPKTCLVGNSCFLWKDTSTSCRK
ncbi:hypothetical protein BDF20DRAFT_843220 [Mycotypha africana]|uniref:uncharacterized protein n=1 Tax=Mycotypha africana TaxID=64632 RepID=UPI0022FFE102|nr:uncharacterized protein BDF20DRAFT_843220 [Mycotypha africana]KAI8991190.1 hypothetical protein BDF20DRAFT_843220 [Mycotypha africana]